MAITLYNLFEAALLCVNAIAVLHEKRFLEKINWGREQVSQGFEPGAKSQIINLIHSVRTVMRSEWPIAVRGRRYGEWRRSEF
ncbi:unnamed protein product [Ixodes persulcatus]